MCARVWPAPLNKTTSLINNISPSWILYDSYNSYSHLWELGSLFYPIPLGAKLDQNYGFFHVAPKKPRPRPWFFARLESSGLLHHAGKVRDTSTPHPGRGVNLLWSPQIGQPRRSFPKGREVQGKTDVQVHP